MRRYIEILFGLIFWAGAYYLLVQTFAIRNISIEEINNQIERHITYDESIVLSIRIGLLLKMCFYYLNVFGLTRIYKKLGWMQYILVVILVGLLFQGIEMVKIKYLIGFSKIEFLEHTVWINIIQYVILGALSFAHFILLKSREDELLTFQLMQEKKNAEFQALKAQVNPHFLFNALNNILSITNRERNDRASDAITQLSEMMRYLLYDASEKSIGLSKEVDLINHYIKINTLRFDEDDKIDIRFDVKGDVSKVQIEPMLLIPFVENGFKHGVDIFNPSYIHIDLEVKENKMYFMVENSIGPKRKAKELEKQDHSGIGIENVRKRLEMIYPHKYSLLCKESEHKYVVDLMIEL